MNTHAPHIFRSPNRDEYWLDERIFVREVMNSPDEPDVSLAVCRVPPGTTTQLHSLDIDEWYMIESGGGLMEIDGAGALMSVGDCVKINAGQSQRITNAGESDLVFTSLCKPRFTPENYTNLEDGI
ncbi:MAG TPA: cupin domain-containing protein [Hellea balneolensis]|uniref:Cupin domain-containing protein n=1 Tax=Hellea balneolensis TaxID=287478 RepID=A0A7C3C8G6_9PROT|nr:cupin domain-containing protein [Hellea balneolensis]